MKKILLFTILCSMSNSFASTTDLTTIEEIMLDNDNGVKVYFKVKQSLPPEDGCRENPNWPYVFDISTDFGKSMYSALLAAYASKSTVKVFGYGTCAVHNAVETVKRIELKSL